MTGRSRGRGALTSLHWVTLSSIVVGYLVIGALYAVHTPPWQVPDEPAHYNYVRHLVERRAFPVLQAGDYDQAYLSRLTSEGFPAHLPIDPVRYEGHQPPLYYLLAAPLFAATSGSLIILRLFSLALGGGVVAFTFLLVRELFPDPPVLSLAAAGFVAFVPQHVAMMAGVNNDSLAELLMALGLWLTVRALKPSTPRPAPLSPAPWPLSLVLGLAFLTKTTVYPLAVVVGAMLLLRARREQWDRRRLISTGIRIFLPALALGALWWGRNLAVYGGLDVLGLQRHDEIVVGQPRTADWLADLGWAEYTRQFLVTTFQSFWGQFGWMGVVMDRRLYLALLAYSLWLGVGFTGAAIRKWKARVRLPEQRDGLILLAVTLLLAAALYLYYNLTFVQFQGRYLYPALPVVGLGAAAGIVQWAAWAVAGSGRDPQGAGQRLGYALSLMPVGLMAALDLFALYRFIIPALS